MNISNTLTKKLDENFWYEEALKVFNFRLRRSSELGAEWKTMLMETIEVRINESKQKLLNFPNDYFASSSNWWSEFMERKWGLKWMSF